MKTFTKYPKSYIRAASSPSDFVIEDGVLKQYVGLGGDVVVPKGVTEISMNCFEYRKDIVSVVIPEGVQIIGDHAFSACENLTKAVIPNTVTDIDDGAFAICLGLTYVNIPSSVNNIGNFAFYRCEHLSSLTIEEGVINIGDSAFENCYNITSVVIPRSVSNIGKEAFLNCKNLASVSILGDPRIRPKAFTGTGVVSISKTKSDKKATNRWVAKIEKLSDLTELELAGALADLLSDMEEEIHESLDIFVEGSTQGMAGFMRIYDDSEQSRFEPIDVDYRDWVDAEYEMASQSASRAQFRTLYEEYIRDLTGI